MKKIIRLLPIVLCAVFLLNAVGCTLKENGGVDEENPPVEKMEVFEDKLFKTGFNILGTGYSDNGNVDHGQRGMQKTIKLSDQTPKWNVAQWYSRHKLDKNEPVITDDMLSISDASKSVKIDRKTGAVTLHINGAKEYTSVQSAATLGAYWPHLLVQPVETMTPIKISDCDDMEARIDFTINTAIDHAPAFGKERAGLQSQFAWIVYVQNTNKESAGFGEFLWFGFNLFDPTKIYAPRTEQQDFAGGTLGNYIYTLGATESIGNERVLVGKRTGFALDVKKAIANGLASAHKKGFMSNTQINDCSITGMNMGFEVYDVWELSVTIYDVGISYIPKK